MHKLLPRILSALLLAAALPPAHAFFTHEHVTLGGTVDVSEGELAGDIACAFCTVHVHGDVQGDVAVAFGNVTVDPDRNVSGDIAIFAGDLNAGENSTLGHDVAIAAGNLNLAPSATVRGDRTVFPFEPFLLVLLAPFLILFGIGWLIVHAIRRNRYPYGAYPRPHF